MDKTKLPFPIKNGDSLEYENNQGEISSYKILAVIEATGAVFVVDSDNDKIKFKFGIKDTLDRINDGLFTVKGAQ